MYFPEFLRAIIWQKKKKKRKEKEKKMVDPFANEFFGI